MRKTTSRMIVGLLAATMIPGCTMTPERRDQLLGGLGGAVLGAATGALAGKGDPRAIAAGALAGGAVGWGAVKLVQYHASQNKSAAQEAQVLGWQPSQGMLIRIQDAQALPPTVAPGETVDLQLEYAVMTPPGTNHVAVEEKWTLSKDGHILAEVPPHREMREAGGWLARASIQIPKNAPGGTYIVENSVRADTSYDVRRADFLVNAVSAYNGRGVSMAGELHNDIE